MSTSTSPTALKWWIACELRKLRERAGITREEAAKAIRVTVANIGHVEVGRWLPKPMELERLLEIYGVPERNEAFQKLRERAKRGRDWWTDQSGAMIEDFNLFLGFESSSIRLDMWDPIAIPGLFQIPDYIATIMRVTDPDRTDAAVAELINLRLARQHEVFKEENTPFVHSVISEAGLQMLVGGREVMRAQLQHLLTLMMRPNVEIQILPFSMGATPAIEGAFTIFSPPPELQRTHGLIYADNLLQSFYYQREDQVKQYSAVMSQLQKQALSPDSSAAFIHDRIRELE